MSEKLRLECGTILRVKPNFCLSTGSTVECSKKHVYVFANTKNGTPQVVSYDIATQTEGDRTCYKTLHWSSKNSSWRYNGHDTEVYFPNK